MKPHHDADGYRRAIRAFGKATTALGRLDDLDDFLHLLVAQLCELVRVPRCSLYLRDDETGLYQGQVGHGAEDRLVKRLTCGLPADRFTREIVDTRAPVVLQDAMHDSRAIVSTMRAWGVTRVMGVPMVQRDEVSGIFFLDSLDAARTFTRADEDIASAFAELAAVAVVQAQLMTDLRTSLATVATQNKAMRQAALVDERLTRLVIEGGDLSEIAGALAELTMHSCAIHGPDLERLSTGTPPGVSGTVTPPELRELRRHPELAPALAADDRGRATTIGPIPEAGLHHRLLIAPVTVRENRWGTVVLMEHNRRFSGFDALVSRRAASIVALELSAARRAVAAEFNARMSLAAGLIRGAGDTTELERHAAHVHVRLDVPHVVCLFAPRTGGGTAMPDARTIAASFEERAPRLQVLSTGVADGVAVLLELPSAGDLADAEASASRLVAEVCRDAGADGDLVAGISSPCSRLDGYARAYADAREVTRCLRSFAAGRAGPSVLTADGVGAARVFLATCDPVEAERFANETLAPVLAVDSGRDELFETLHWFLRSGRSVRRAAEALDVHENTVRYRLARLEKLAGACVTTDADTQLRMQLALAVLQLQGRISLSPIP